MKKILFTIILLTCFNNVYADKMEEIKEEILLIIKNGSNQLDYPMGEMPPMIAQGQDAEDIATYIAGGMKGEQPTSFAPCASCHGADGKGMGGMSPDLAMYLCANGNTSKCIDLASSFAATKDYTNMLKFLSKACDGSDLNACNEIGLLYSGWYLGSQDFFKALTFFKRACNGGVTDGCFHAGLIYAEGKSVRQSYIIAKEFFGKACDDRNTDGCTFYANINKNETYKLNNSVKHAINTMQSNINMRNDPEMLKDTVCLKMNDLIKILTMFWLDNGSYPDTEEGLKILLSNTDPEKYPNYRKKPYLSKTPRDVWGNNFSYIEKGNSVELVSLGKDGLKGGSGINEDIYLSQCGNSNSMKSNLMIAPKLILMKSNLMKAPNQEQKVLKQNKKLSMECKYFMQVWGLKDVSVLGLNHKDTYLAIRKGPGSKYKLLEKVYNGDSVKGCNTKGNWVKIIFGCAESGDANDDPSIPCQMGWAYKKYLSPLGGATLLH